MSRLVERIKAGVIGQSGVGKTHFLHGFLFGDRPHRRIEPTVAVEFYERITMVDSEEVSLRIWDTSGQEKYKPIVSYHLRECQVIILMFDLTDFDSFAQLENWVALLRREGFDPAYRKLLVIGNKLDLVRCDPGQREVRYEQVKEMLVRLRLPVDDIYEVTSNAPKGEDIQYIQEILQEIMTEILVQRSQDELETMRVKLGKEGILLSQPDQPGESEAYCGECQIY